MSRPLLTRIAVPTACLAALCGCARFVRVDAGAATANSPADGSIAAAPQMRTAFSAALTMAVAGQRVPVLAKQGAKTPSGSVHLTFRPDDVLEYELTIANADQSTFGSAYLYRISGSSKQQRVATLFTDASLSGPHVQLRGTGMVAAPLSTRDLLEKIREAPGSYSVLVVSLDGRAQGLVGHLR
jgi:hypothetical protein